MSSNSRRRGVASKHLRSSIDRTRFRPSAISIAVAAAVAGAVSLPSASLAQDDGVIEEIITTGYRSSLRNSMLMKQNSDSIVEAVTAEDIGKLPDASIAESLARLPGLTAQRLNGRGQQISIRGLGPDFTTALLNGREQVTTGDNRGVEFDQYPSELLSSVIIYKTPDASLIGAGLAGTADMRTIRPLQRKDRIIAGNIRYEWTDLEALNAGSTDDGERATFSYVDQFADDTVGFALGISYMSNPGQEERFNSWGYPDSGDGNAVIGGSKPFVRSSELERTGVIGVLEYAPSDNFSTALDIYYSDFQEEQLLRGIELPLFWGGLALEPGYTAENGLVTEGQFNGVVGVMRNDITARDSELFAAGWNLKFGMGENWTGTVDLSTSSVDREDIILETYSGTGYARSGPTDNMAFAMTGDAGAVFNSILDYTDPNLVMLTDPQGWGGSTVQAGYDNEPKIDDELNQLHLAAERELDGSLSSIEFGVNLARREKDKAADEWLLSFAGGATEQPLPGTVGTTDLSFLGIPGMISYDPLAALASGVYVQVPNSSADVAIKSWFVEEDVNLAYVQLGLDTEWGSIPVSGNFGVQVMDVEQKSEAFVAANSDGSTAAESGGTDWTEVLPSVNLTFSFANDNYVRFAVARTVARARMDQMRASWQWSFNNSQRNGTTPESGPWGGGGGNPEVEPWLANAVDLSYEKYFQDGSGYVAVAVFYKDLDQFIVELPVLQDFTGFPTPDPAPGQDPTIGTFEGFVTRPVNGEGGEISGVEFSLSLTGDLLHDALADFGFVGNYSVTNSSIKPIADGPEIPIPGLSEDVANLTLYYENENFSARVSNRYRSEFLGEVTGFGGGREFRSVQSESIVDAQLAYNFSGSMQGFSVFLQGFNLTDEPLHTTASDDDTRLIIDYQRYGRSYMIGASYRYE